MYISGNIILINKLDLEIKILMNIKKIGTVSYG